MAILDKPLRVPILDGAVLFQVPLQNEWALEAKRREEVQAGEKTTDQLIDELLAKVVGVENFFYADGTPVTPDDLRARRYPQQFLHQIFEAYHPAVASMFKDDAAAKNAPTPA